MKTMGWNATLKPLPSHFPSLPFAFYHFLQVSFLIPFLKKPWNGTISDWAPDARNFSDRGIETVSALRDIRCRRAIRCVLSTSWTVCPTNWEWQAPFLIVTDFGKNAMFSLLVTETAPFFMGKIWEVTPAIGPLGHWAIGPLGHWAIGPLGHWLPGLCATESQAGQGLPRTASTTLALAPRKTRSRIVIESLATMTMMWTAIRNCNYWMYWFVLAIISIFDVGILLMPELENRSVFVPFKLWRVTSSGAHLESFDRIVQRSRDVSGTRYGLLSLVHWSCSLHEAWDMMDMFSKDPSG